MEQLKDFHQFIEENNLDLGDDLNESSPSFSYDAYCDFINHQINPLTERYYVDVAIPRGMERLRKDVVRMAKMFKVSIRLIWRALKSKDVYAFLKVIKFNIYMILDIFSTIGDLVRDGLMDGFRTLSDQSFMSQYKTVIEAVDAAIDKFPVLRKVTGPVIFGIYVIIWLNMSFIMNLKYDFDFSKQVQALRGNWKLSDFLAEPDGMMLLTLFLTGSFISFPWLGSTVLNVMILVVVTAMSRIPGEEARKHMETLKAKVKLRTSK